MQTFAPAPGADLNHLAVELVICDEIGRPRRKQIWSVMQLLRSKLSPLPMH